MGYGNDKAFAGFRVVGPATEQGTRYFGNDERREYIRDLLEAGANARARARDETGRSVFFSAVIGYHFRASVICFAPSR